MNTKLSIVLGLLYGIGLSVASILLAGAGHGSYALLGLASAPVGAVGIKFALAAPPVIWGAMFGLRFNRGNQGLFVVVLVVQYISAAILLLDNQYGDWTYLQSVWEQRPSIVLLGVCWYLLGQIFLWIRLPRDFKGRDVANHSRFLKRVG